MGQNGDFINDICSICGGVDIDNKALSEVQILCGYGSENDGDTINIRVCGKCADKLYKIIQKRAER